MVFPEYDKKRSPIYFDLKQEEDNREYREALCADPHEDGSTCNPTHDGHTYVCTHQILKGYGTPVCYSEPSSV